MSLMIGSCGCCNDCCPGACDRIVKEVHVDLDWISGSLSSVLPVNDTIKNLKCWKPFKIGNTNQKQFPTGHVRDVLVEFHVPGATSGHPAGVFEIETCLPKSVQSTVVLTSTNSDKDQSWYWPDERYMIGNLSVRYKQTVFTLALGSGSSIQDQIRALDTPPGAYPELATATASLT